MEILNLSNTCLREEINKRFINLFLKPAGEGLAQHQTPFTVHIRREGRSSSDYRSWDSRHPHDSENLTISLFVKQPNTGSSTTGYFFPSSMTITKNNSILKMNSNKTVDLQFHIQNCPQLKSKRNIPQIV